MPRIARIVGAGYPHHIVQRGNNRENVFLDRTDYEKYLFLLTKYSEEKKAAILAYCLMPNHVHLLVTPSQQETLAKLMQGVTLCYTQHFNRKERRTGRLWECRYYSTIIDRNSYLWTVGKYIENNPVRAGISEKPEEYPYSSARAHILGRSDRLLNGRLFDKDELREYRKIMKLKEDEKVLEEIRKQTGLGKPLGDEGFVKTLSEKIGYCLAFRTKGRPRKNNSGIGELRN